jgi:hypothetical protein
MMFRLFFFVALLVPGVHFDACAQDVDFATQIRPLLNRHCLACHGADEEHREADLRLDSFEGATASAVVPHRPEESELVARISSDDESDCMPPSEHGKLTAEEIELIRAWIKSGAEYAQHWSFIKPQQSPVPTNPFAGWGFNEIDHFIGDRLQQVQLIPSAPAEPHRLLRRLSLALTGLPPSDAHVAQWIATPNLETYEQLVDEMLASPAFGEHWAAMWLDLARYADTIGYTEDHPRTIWPWRDWVIRALNSNMPFDQFTREQLAGDLLENATDEQRLATAFHRNTVSNSEGGTIDEEFRVIAVKDRINTTVNVWMGLTMRCAECHTHKYDPISIAEYYQFYDFFNQTEDADRADEEPRMDFLSASQKARLLELDRLIEEKTRAPGDVVENPANEVDKLDSELEKLKQQRLEASTPVKVPILRELAAGKRRTTHLLTRGSYLNPADEVQAAVPSAFHPLPNGAEQNRLGVAQWLVDLDNPLTARVTVNRFWARIFGRGIVETEEDFGIQGKLPTHPQLLDWMAVDFQQNGWDVKRLLKQMVMSATYRQASHATPERWAGDPQNLFYSRGPRVRLSAEVLRDQALMVSGLLSDTRYGPPVYPPSPIKVIRNSFAGDFVWATSQGENRYRRAIYTFLKRSQPHPLFDTFDMATRQVCSFRRIPTNTPLQSFMTLNDEAFIECAQHLALKMRSHSDDLDKQLTWGLQTALRCPPEADQVAVLKQMVLKILDEYRENPDLAKDAIGHIRAQAEVLSPLQIAELASLSMAANVILNMDAFLTK